MKHITNSMYRQTHISYMNVRIATYTSGYTEITSLPFLCAVHYTFARRPQWEKNAILLVVFLLSTTLSPAYSDLEFRNSAVEYATTAVVYVIGAKNDRTSDSVCVISADDRHIVLSHRGQQGSDTGHIVPS